eukprot:COSAG01_NODE_28881_length_650_cov_1.335753_2_plen_63_part_01
MVVPGREGSSSPDFASTAGRRSFYEVLRSLQQPRFAADTAAATRDRPLSLSAVRWNPLCPRGA